ncbi:hypothetical protein FB45DRAFT_827564 [Roridomyces roridus]|uniref:DUF676 domain-containing protein n=1 Tax=Roridomyces roridus TaxID=1738132 RepID=A0AAD7C4X7_9AGAR|nr:hypothetical protein FB45DRAFT_827564 [Roridomyces roridus]
MMTTTTNSELVICVFIHGFKGTDETFGSFPERLQHLLSETISDAAVECVVFPSYETKGELDKAVVRFSDWLTNLTVEKEVASGLGAGKAKIVLLGHSMGGLLAADTLRDFVNSRPDPQAPLWPRIIGLVAFDTPYLGLHPAVFKTKATKAVEYAQTARTVGTSVLGAFAGAGFGASKASSSSPSSNPGTPPPPATASGWGKWAGAATYAVGGALLAGAAAGATYYNREELGLGIDWATGHMKYVGNLWDQDALNRRMEFLVNSKKQEGILFRNFYTYLPPTPLLSDAARTFVVLPKTGSPAEPYFILARNGLAADPVEAHTHMFSGKTNDGFYDLGLQAAQLIREVVLDDRAPAAPPSTAPDAKISEAVAPPTTPPSDIPPSPWAATSSSAQPLDPAMAEWGKEWQ